MSVASVVLFNRYALSGNGEFGKKLTEAIQAAPLHGGRKYIEVLADGDTGKFLEILVHNPARIYDEHIARSRQNSRHGNRATLVTLIWDVALNHLADIALADQVAEQAYEALNSLPASGTGLTTRFAA